MGKILTVKELNAWYRVRDGAKKIRKQALHKVSFQMEEGEILGLVGESGCGKSTLARSLLSMVKETEGEIVCADSRPQMIFQDPRASLNPAKKVGWILEEPLRNLTALSLEERRGRAAEMLLRVGLSEEHMNAYPHQLSGGQSQRVCIGAALMIRPALVLADEAVSALDVTVQKQILELLLRLKQEMGLSILFISHDLRVVYQLCDRVIIMRQGRIVEEGETDRVYFSPRHEYTRSLLRSLQP